MGTHGGVARRKRRRFWPWVVFAVVAVLAVCAVVFVPRGQSAAAEPTPSLVSAGASASASAVPVPVLSDQRGEAVAPSTARVALPVGGSDGLKPGYWVGEGGPKCQWSRDKGVSWKFDTGGAAREKITISLRLSMYFVTENCGYWTFLRP